MPGGLHPAVLYADRGRRGRANAAGGRVHPRRKEPKYESAHPFRGTVKFGTQTFAYVFDTKDAKSDAYSRMYFDLKHSGDLCGKKQSKGKRRGCFRAAGAITSFPASI